MEDYNSNEIIRSICYGKRVQHVIENALQIAKKRGSALIGYDVTPFILDKNDHASSGFVVIAWKRVNDLGATPVSHVDDRTTLQHNGWVAFNKLIHQLQIIQSLQANLIGVSLCRKVGIG